MVKKSENKMTIKSKYETTNLIFHFNFTNRFKLKFAPKTYKQIRLSIVVSIPACHAGDPGSIPGVGAYFFLFLILY